MYLLFRFACWRNAEFRDRLKTKNIRVQIRTQDGKHGRIFIFKDGHVSSKVGVHSSADFSLVFKTYAIAVKLLMPPINQLEQIEAMKNFLFHPEGKDEDCVWFAQTVMTAISTRW